MKRILLLTLAALAFAVLPVLAVTPAGTIIRNQAAATVGETVYLSNTVETIILPLCGVSLLPDGTPENPGQVASVSAGGTAYLNYQIENTGNDTFTYNLAVYQDDSSQWVPESTSIVLDANRNGQVDPGEEEITSIELAAGESAGLILVVKAPGQGGGDLLISPAASCEGGATDNQNYARVSLVSGPALQVEKSMTPTEAAPGDTVHVNLTVRNVGDEPTNGSVTLSDDLSPLLSVLEYVPSTLTAPKGSLEYFDGSSWQTTEPPTVEAVRLVLAGLDVGEGAILSFDLRVLAATPPQSLENTAVAGGPGGPAESTAVLEILPSYKLYLGPIGNPRALPDGEGSADDRQEANLIAGQRYCFAHTLENASNVADDFVVEASGLPANVSGVFEVASGLPLAQPLHLEAGATFDFLYCLDSASPIDSPFTVDIVATSRATGEENHTYDTVSKVYSVDLLALSKDVDPQGTVAAGETLHYTLTIINNYPFDITNVTITDALSESLEYVSSSPSGSYDSASRQVEWSVSKIDAGATWTADLVVRVKRDTADNTKINNKFSLRSDQITSAQVSNTTETPVWTSSILISKQVSPQEAKYGDKLHYTIKVTNPSTAPLTVKVTDVPAKGLSYISGSATPSEPEKTGSTLVWDGISIDAGGTAVIEYDMRVGVGAAKKLLNTATAQGVASSGAAVASVQATAQVLVADEVFMTRKATIVGRVFLDVDRNGLYERGKDVPLPGARLLLPDGRQALTDSEGRYAFRDIEAGTWMLTLDKTTAPFLPLEHPEADCSGYVHRVRAWGLTVSDYPLQAPAGVIEAIRSTELFMGPLRVEKRLIPLTDSRYRVVLHVQSDQVLPDLVLRDPQPNGEEKVFDLGDFSGEKTITYELEGRLRMTDPEVRWRYP